ncbi:MAG: transposase [Phycisphaerales bacterium]|jgi:REP element-mobilizing transposase RayT
MAKTLGYMVTWTTYGTWLQGHEKGYVKDGIILGANAPLANANKERLKKDPVILTRTQRKIIETAILKKANEIGEKIYAIAICSNHVHIVNDYTTKDIGLIVRYYKMAGQIAMRDTDLSGRLWTKGFDNQFCFDEQTLRARINYVNKH